MSKQFTLGKQERLKSRKQIEQLFSEGKSFAVSPYRVFYHSSELQLAQESSLQFGVGVSTKHFKKAVDRNRIKRLTRECWRLQKNELKEKLNSAEKKLNVFLVFTGREMVDYSLVNEKLNLINKRLIKLVHESNSPAA